MGAVLVTEMLNYRYLTGFTGTRGYLLVSGGGACLFTDFRYIQQAREQTLGLDVREIGSRWVEDIHRYLVENKNAIKIHVKSELLKLPYLNHIKNRLNIV